MFGKKRPSDGGALGWDGRQRAHAYVCVLVCMCTLFVGKGYIKGRRVCKPNFAAINLVVSLLGK